MSLKIQEMVELLYMEFVYYMYCDVQLMCSLVFLESRLCQPIGGIQGITFLFSLFLSASLEGQNLGLYFGHGRHELCNSGKENRKLI